MNDESMSKEQLLDELKALRKEVDRFRTTEAERERYVKELKERAQFLESVLETSPIVFTITRRKDGCFMLVSAAHGRESGYSPEEVIGKTSLELDMYVNKADRDAFVKILEETGELNNFELQYRNKDGSVRDVLLFARPLSYAGEECMLTASLPITKRKLAEQKLTKYRDRLEELVIERTAKMKSEIAERKRAEEALLKEKLLFEEYLNSLPGLFYVFDEERFVKWNSPWNRITGYSDEELGKRYGPDFFEGEDRIHIGEQMAKVFREGAGEAEGELVTKDGRRIPCFFTGLRKKLSGKDYLIGLGIDVTARKQAEEALRESEEKYRTILESIEDGYYEADIAGSLVFFNDALCKMFGHSKDELRGMNYRQFTDEETAKQGYDVFNKVYTTGRADKGFDWKIIRKDGTRRSVEVSVSLRREAEGKPTGFRGIVRDISEKMGIHAQLQHARKMEAIGTLAGGVAHEFNNALMGIMGNIELLKMDLPEDERRAKYFEAMKGSGHRMSRLTDQLLAYAQGGKYQPKDLRLDGFIIETLPILQHEFNPEVRVETHFEKVSYIKADYTQMQMVIAAILANSNEAIEDQGLIKITAGNEDVDEDSLKQRPGLKPGYYVCLSIEDNGKGMDEETKDGIFEPFFTTKFQGRGMGMAAVYGIVKNHGGWIFVDSELGKGTIVEIYLPVSAVEIEKPKKDKVEVTKGSGTILMIEDEDVVIEVTQTMLEILGYRVMVAKTGNDAIHIAETFDGQIDLALLDIKLPDMDGGKVYPLIMEARPGLKVIVFSGFAIEGPARNILDAGAQGFIQKPFSIGTLADKVKEVLERE